MDFNRLLTAPGQFFNLFAIFKELNVSILLKWKCNENNIKINFRYGIIILSKSSVLLILEIYFLIILLE